MKVNVDLRLKDVPGQLVWALEPISANDGNIRGVVHHHDAMMGGRIAVNVTFEVRSDKTLERILDIWKEREIDVVRMDAVFESYPVQYLLVGNISSGEIESITKGLEAMEGLASLDVRFTGSVTSSKRAAMVTGKAIRKEALEPIEQFFRKRAEDGGYTLIRGLD